jgi:hypothetical protein
MLDFFDCKESFDTTISEKALAALCSSRIVRFSFMPEFQIFIFIGPNGELFWKNEIGPCMEVERGAQRVRMNTRTSEQHHETR